MTGTCKLLRRHPLRHAITKPAAPFEERRLDAQLYVRLVVYLKRICQALKEN